MSGRGFAVIDVETTGLSPRLHDRVVEIAVAHVDTDGRITGEWETLVNPRRDLGPQHIHGIRTADVLPAPEFDGIAAELVELLRDRVIVAHNVAFDLRFLRAELERAGLALHDDPPALDTMRLAVQLRRTEGRTLRACCDAFDIELRDAHRASIDAHATALLFGRILDESRNAALWRETLSRAERFAWPHSLDPVVGAAWVTRPAASAPPADFVARLVTGIPDQADSDQDREYLGLLDRVLLDRLLSAHEEAALLGVAREWGIGADRAIRLHRDYFAAMTAAAWADGVLTTDEISDLALVARLLHVPADELVAAMQPPAVDPPATPASTVTIATESATVSVTAPAVVWQNEDAFTLAPGDVVVLTGDMARPRELLEAELHARGYRTGGAVSKKVKLVIAADPDSLSGKARKARDYGIPIVGERWLERMLAD